MAKKKCLDFKSYAKFKNCFVNSEAKALLKDEDSVICHYMPYLRLEGWIKKSVMTFASPSRWDDPFEKIYLGSTLLNLPLQKNYTPPQIACLCFTKSLYKDSVAFWNSFKNNESTQLVRVVFNFNQLIVQLIESLRKQNLNANVYVAAIDYSLPPGYIQDKNEFIYRIINRCNEKNMSAESLFVKMLSCKRKAFAFENEIRIILVPQMGEFKFDENGCIEVKNIDFRSIVEKIWLEPIRLPMGWFSEDSIRVRLPKFKKKISQSSLYEEQEICKKIDLSKIQTKV